MKTYLTLIILLPLLGSLFNALLGRHLPRRLGEFVACVAVWGSFAASLAALSAYSAPTVVQAGSWLSAFDLSAPLSFMADPLSLSLCLMITFVCGLIHVYSVAYMAGEFGFARYFALLNLFTAAMLVLVLAENLPLLYLGWEGVGFCSYALIGFWYRKAENADAGRKAFIVTRIGDIGLAVAVVWLYQILGTVSISEINRMAPLVPVEVAGALGLLMLLGAMGKSAQLPLSVWLPDAMAGPTPVSAQIHAATMVTAGVYLLMRLFPLISLSPLALSAIALTGGLTALYGATCALCQRDLKRVLAYSTISQIGYMTLGVGAGAIGAATFHLIVHAFFKALLFLAAGCVITYLHHEQDIFRMGGLARRLPLTFWSFLAGGLCLAAIPPTGGFFSKDAILAAVWGRGGDLYGALFVLGLVTALLTSLYTFRTILLVFGGEPAEHPGGAKPAFMEALLVPLAILGVCGGLLDLPGGKGLLSRFLAPLTTAPLPLPHRAELILQGAAAAVAGIGLGIAWYCYGGKRRPARIGEARLPSHGLAGFFMAGWRLDGLYEVLFVRPYKRLARFLWECVDVGLLGRSVDLFASLLGRSGRAIGSWGRGRVSISVMSMAAAAALIICWLTGVLQ